MQHFIRRLTATSTSMEPDRAAIANLPIPPLVAGRGLAAAGDGDLGGRIDGLAGFLVLTFGFFAVCVWLAERCTRPAGCACRAAAARSAASSARPAPPPTAGWLGRAPGLPGDCAEGLARDSA